MNHWPKFKIISQNCSSGCPLPKLHKWLRSNVQKGARASDKKNLKTTFPPEPLIQIQNNFTGLFLMMTSSNIAQMVSVHWTKGLTELYIKMSLNNMSSWTTGRNFILLHMNVPHDALFQNCINGSAPPNRRAARAPSKNLLNDISSWTTDPNSKLFHRIVPLDVLYQHCTNGWAPLSKGLPERQIRITFYRHFLLRHWAELKIVSQDSFSWCLLPKLHKWF